MVKKFKQRSRLKNWLLRSIKLAKNADPNKYKYSGYSIGFYSCAQLLFKDGSTRKYLIIFGANISSSVHNDHKNEDSEGPTQELDYITLAAEAKYLINFTQLRKRFALSLHYLINFTQLRKRFALSLHQNGRNSFLFLDATKIYQSEAKNSEIKVYILW